jgi:uncharacterized protein
MVQAEKKKPVRKGRPSRKRKNRLKDLTPIIAILAILAVFLLWRILAVLPQHKIPHQAAPPVEKKAAGTLPKTETAQKPPQKKEPPEIKPEKEFRPPPAKTPTYAPPPVKPTPAPEKKEKPAAPGAPSVRSAGKVAVVIDDVGSNMELLKEAVRLLPKSVTFAVIPFQPYSKESAEMLHREGFHIILHSPMEAEDQKKDQLCIRVGMSQREVSKILALQLESVPYAEGVNNHTGSKATRDPVVMSYVMSELKNRGLYFLDSRTTPFTTAFKTAKEYGVKSAERKVFLDDESSESGILLKVDELSLSGMKEKKAVGIGHLRPNTIKVLSQRLYYWQKREVEFIPLEDAVE